MRDGLFLRRRLADITRVVACLAVASAAAAPARAASSPQFVGTNLQTLGAVAPAAQDGVLDRLAASRMTLARVEISWPQIEPQPVAGGADYQWDGIDALVRRLALRGLRAVPIFRHSPTWAWGPGDPGTNELPASSYPAFGRMIAAFAARYGPGGAFWRTAPQLTPRPTLSYEIWNEANLDEYAWNRDANPEAYAALIVRVRPIIRAAQPSAVLLASLAYQPGDEPNFLGRFAAAGGLAAIDAMGYHPYAPDAAETIRLVQGLRGQLAALGKAGMPIYANEAGQEAVVTNPDGTTTPQVAPAEWGWQHFPSDAARGANLAFAAEALGASDCGVEQFLPYSVSDTEQAGGKLTEAYMGLFRPKDGAATQTALALGRASLRWAQRFDAGGPGAPAALGLCGPGAPGAQPLAIDGAFTGTGQPGCVALSASYDGNPLEAVALQLRGTGGEVLASRETNAFGQASACVPEAARGSAFTAVGWLLNAGATGEVECDVAAVGCPGGVAMRPGTGRLSAVDVTGIRPTPAPTPATPPACTWKLSTTQSSYTPAKGRREAAVTIKAAVGCGTSRSAKRLRFNVYTRASGTKRQRKQRTVVLTPGVAKRLTVRGKLRGGTRITLSRRTATGIPLLTDSFTVSARKPAKKPARRQ
ncbi:MAG: hypothetical protein J7513_07875 [Solirubrobacteraceae bacterium]|nr:hypothetical protein [Solirubrobacteraceae bacterium]